MWPAIPVVNSAREVHHWPSIVRHRCFGSTALCTRLNIGLCLCPVVRHSWLSNFGQEFSVFFIQCQSDEKKTNITKHPKLLHSVPVRKGADIFHKRLPSGPLPHPCCVHWRHSWPALPALPQASIYMHYAGKTQPLQLQRQAKVFNERFFAAQPFCVACHSEITRALKHRRHT